MPFPLGCRTGRENWQTAFNGGRRMPFRIRDKMEFWSAAVFVLFGIAFLSISPNYEFGSLSRIGSGFFPTVLSILLIIIGLAIGVRSLARTERPVGRPAFLPILLVTLSMIAFAVTVENAGAVVAIVLITIIASFASKQFNWITRLSLAVVLTVFSIIVFIWGLGMPVPILGAWFGV